MRPARTRPTPTATTPTGIALNEDYGHGYSQTRLYGSAGGSAISFTLNSHNVNSSGTVTAPSTNGTIPWNYFPQTVNLKNNISASGGYYYLVKYWDKSATPATSSNTQSGNPELVGEHIMGPRQQNQAPRFKRQKMWQVV